MARLKSGVRLRRLKTKRAALEKLIKDLRRQQRSVMKKLDRAYRELAVTGDRIRAEESR